MKNQKLIYSIFVFSIFISRLVSGQTIEMLMVPDSISTFKLDYSKLIIPNLGLERVSGNYSLEINKVINKKFSWFAEFPILHFSEYDFKKKTIWGNLLLGIQLKTSDIDKVKSSLNVGVYLPTASNNINSSGIGVVWFNGLTEYGFRTNLFEYPKYPYKTTTMYVGANSFYFLSNRLRIGFELGSNLLISTRGNYTDRDLLAKYGLSLMYPKDKDFNFQLELLGVSPLSEERTLGKKTVCSYALGLGHNGDRFGIGVYYRNYFNNLNINGFKGIFETQFYLFSANNRRKTTIYSKSDVY